MAPLTARRSWWPRALAAVALLLAPLARGGDAATLAHKGFSANGRYLSFSQSGVYDGSGFPWAQVFLVDVEANSWVGAPCRAVGESDEASIGSVLGAAQDACVLRSLSLGIGPSASDKGDRIELAPVEVLADGGEHEPTVGQRTFEVDGRAWALRLEQIPTGDSVQMVQARMLRLSLVDAATGAAKTLQADTRLPRSRGMPYVYAIHEAWLHRGRHLVVYIELQTPGFEGPDTRYMAITGTLDVPEPGAL